MAQANYVPNALCAPITGAHAKRSTNSVPTASAELIAGAAKYAPRSIFEPSALKAPGPLDFHQIDALLSDLPAGMAGTPQLAGTAWRVS
jgi:hypothetical protein